MFNLILYPGKSDKSPMLAFTDLRDFFRSSRDFKNLLDTVPPGPSVVDDSFNDCITSAFCEHGCTYGIFSTILIPWSLE